MKRISIVAGLLGLMATVIAPSFAAGPYIYVANTGEDTVSRIDADTNTEVARFATWFTSGSPNYVAPRVYPRTRDGTVPVPHRKEPCERCLRAGPFLSVRIAGDLPVPVLLKIAPSAVGPVVPMLDKLPTNSARNLIFPRP